MSNGLKRVPIARYHAIEKDSLKIKKLEQVLIGKPLRAIPGHALERAAKKQMPVSRDKRALCIWNRARFLRLGDSTQSQRDLTHFCVDESGTAALEYGLIVTLITLGVLAAIRYMGHWTLGVFNTVGNNLTSS